MLLREELWILESCLLTPMSRNSVLEDFSVRRFEVIEDEIQLTYAGVKVSQKEGMEEWSVICIEVMV